MQLSAPIDGAQSLNMPLQAVGLLNVTYGDMTIENGQAYPADQVNARPSCESMMSAMAGGVLKLDGEV